MRPGARFSLLCRALGVVFVAGFLAAAYTPLAEVCCERALLAPRIGPADAVVVLGSGVDPEGELTGSSQRKALQGIELHHEGLAPLLVFVGADSQEGEARRRFALELGVSGEAILTGSGAHTTRDEALQAAALLRPHGARRVLLVTGALHMRRAAGLFARAGLEVSPAPISDTYCREAIPEQRLVLATLLVREALALAYHHLAGYL